MKDAQFYQLLGKCKSKPQQDAISHLLEWLLSTRQEITIVGEVKKEDKKEPSFTAGGNVK